MTDNTTTEVDETVNPETGEQYPVCEGCGQRHPPVPEGFQAPQTVEDMYGMAMGLLAQRVEEFLGTDDNREKYPDLALAFDAAKQMRDLVQAQQMLAALGAAGIQTGLPGAQAPLGFAPQGQRPAAAPSSSDETYGQYL